MQYLLDIFCFPRGPLFPRGSLSGRGINLQGSLGTGLIFPVTFRSVAAFVSSCDPTSSPMRVEYRHHRCMVVFHGRLRMGIATAGQLGRSGTVHENFGFTLHQSRTVIYRTFSQEHQTHPMHTQYLHYSTVHVYHTVALTRLGRS